MEILIASANMNKQKEIMQIINQRISWVIDPGVNKAIKDVEVGKTFYENASLKAMAAAKYSGKLALADDSGLEVFSLDNQPGIYSARYAGNHASDEQNVQKLLKEMEDIEDREARFVCVAILASGSSVIASAEGHCRGKIIYKPVGENGFGYDPVFIPEGYDRTMAQLTSDQKNQISHRGKALKKIAGGIQGITENPERISF